jgi:mRNA-degrading endonuclease RelE of RelBE toxin-antitoxin system
MTNKFKESELQNLPACAAEYIKLVIKKMRYRKKVRTDVMAELAAHFEDELRDCKTDEEKEQKAQQLIEDFGDVKLLGVLLRRAKKRCRPLWRTVVARTFQAAGVLILCLIIYIAWFLTGKPVITTDYVAELNCIVRPTADESLNAALLYNKAAELYKEKSSDEISKLLGTKYNEAAAEQKQLIEKWLKDNEEIFELVIAGTQKPFYWQKYEEGKGGEGMMSVLLPHLAEFRKLTYSLQWRACLSAEQGRYVDAFDDVKTCYRFGQHIRSGKTIIGQLVAIAIEALTLQTLRDVLDEHRFDSAALDTLQQDFEQMIADEDFTVNIKTEKLLKYDVIQRCFTEGQSGHIMPKRLSKFGDMFPGPAPENIFEEFIFVFSDMSVLKTITYMFTLHPNKQQTKETVDQLYDYLERIMHKSPAQIRAEGIDVEEETMKIIKGNILLEILLPAYQRIHQMSYRVPTDVNATLAIIATLRYKQKTGNYPDSLNELLTAGYIKQLPMDAFSNKPLVYKKENNNFTLYGVGHNFTDDGGRVYRDDKGGVKLWADEGDAVFWPVQK